MHQVALLIARCALAREESRGAHFRTDYPETRDAFRKALGGQQQARCYISVAASEPVRLK